MIKNENQNKTKNSYVEEQAPGEIIKAFENYDNQMDENRPIENNEKEKDEKKDIIKPKFSWIYRK